MATNEINGGQPLFLDKICCANVRLCVADVFLVIKSLPPAAK